MEEIDESVLDKLRKILKHIQEGQSGEKIAAAKLLKQLLEKYKLKIEDIQVIKRKKRIMLYKNKAEKRLLVGCMDKVLLGADIYAQKDRQCLYANMSEWEYLQVRELFEFHKDNFYNEFEKLMLAYVHKHKLFHPRESSGESTMTQEEINEIIAMMSGLSDKSLTKRIEA